MANRELFQKLYDHMVAKPETIDMFDWIMHDRQGSSYINPITLNREVRTCGTTRCAFGWIAAFHDLEADPNEWARAQARKLLADDEVEGFDVAHSPAEAVVGAYYLGIDIDDAYDLFFRTGNDEIGQIVREYADGIRE